SDDEIAVCNLGSVNLAAHIRDGALDLPVLESTVRTAMRMLDNVIDINYYPVPQARNANLKHRPVGLGLMGFQDALYALGHCYASSEAVAFASRSTEAISYYAILASTELAAERGAYASYLGSKWDRGLLPVDTLALLSEERGFTVDVDVEPAMDWNRVRTAVRRYGMRNSNTMAIAPTATISNIVGVSQSIEPSFSNLYVKSNLSGEFTIVNEWLISDLKGRGLWDRQMLDDLKHADGS
ncbi:MAG: ribonucleoside-diphosphate reductase subunit alpha, partial [Ottowia sp.]|nr:ribonucleoside-diphosphate reductase subunit alpha [Ottowia sp.]